MLIHEYVDQEIDERKEWALRRNKGTSSDKKLMIITCVDERIPVYESLGICEQDAYVFRNAGGIITDDAIRSAMISTLFYGTQEIIILNHTGCELALINTDNLLNALSEHDIDLENLALNPALPTLKLADPYAHFPAWIGTFKNVDDLCQQQVELLQESPLLPDDIIVHGYIWQVESASLRRPHEKVHELIDQHDS